jgi:hypothetical protein
VERLHLSGFLAWLSWLLVHIFYLMGFKNRIVVLLIWAWSYFTYRRGARLITSYETLHEPLQATDGIGALPRAMAASAADDLAARRPAAKRPAAEPIP